MAVTTDKPAPYAPASAILDLIDRYRNRGLPSPINTDVLGRSGVSDSLIPRTLQTLQTLDLIDENGQPTKIFEAIRLAPEPEYKQQLQEWLNAAYADVITFVDPSADDETKVRDAFRTYNPVGQQSRMVSLFLGLYAAAGVARERQSRTRQSRDGRQQNRTPGRDSPKDTRSARKKQQVGDSSGIPAPIAGLLSSLPPPGTSWTAQERERFVTTFGAVLDYCFPVVESSATGLNQDSEEGEPE